MTTLERYNELRKKYLAMAKRNNLTETTLASYENTAKLLYDFLLEREKSGNLSADGYVSFDDIQAWIDHLAEHGNKPSTIKRKLVAASRLFSFATKPYIAPELRYEQSPVSSDFYPKVPAESVPEALTDDETIGLWEYKKNYRVGEAQFSRNYAIVTLILTTGLRNKEVLDLTLDSIDLDTGEIYVRQGKGRKDRIVDMDNGPDGLCAAALENYLRIGDRPLNAPDSAPLFGTTAGHAFGDPSANSGAEKWHRGSRQWLTEVIERHVYNQVGRHDCRSHDLRHTFARIQLNSTGNLAELQSAMGHTSPVVTERYSGRLMQRRRREETKKIIAARDEAAAQLRHMNEQERKVIPFTA